MSAGCGAVLVDPLPRSAASEEPNDRDRSPAGDAHLVVLAHPGESGILKSTGYSWNALFWQGRYVWLSEVICLDCGTVFERRTLTSPGPSCATGCLLPVAAGVAVGIWLRSTLTGFLAGYGLLIFWWFVVGRGKDVYTRWRFSERAAALARERDGPHCGRDNAVSIKDAKGARCSACSAMSLDFVVVGKS